MLALLYALRALAFVMFLALPLSWVSVLLFSASLGSSGSHRSADQRPGGYMFGPTHMSMLWASSSSATARQLPRRLGRRPALRHPGQL